MASALSLGAGANEGLDRYLERMIVEQHQRQLEQQQAEIGRHNVEAEGIQRGQLESQDADRKARAAEMVSKDSEAAANRADTLAIRRVSLRPIGSIVTPEEKADETTAHGIPSGLYGDWQPGSMGKSTAEGEVGPNKEGMPWTGTQDQRTNLVKANNTGRHGEDKGVVHDTEKGLVRIYGDGTSEPVTDNEGSVLKGFHQPPISVLQTDSGFSRVNRNGGAATPINDASGSQVQPKLPAQITNRMDMADRVVSHFGDIQTELKEAHEKGLLGPIEGRLFADFMANKIGTTGNKEADDLLGELRMDLSLARSGLASLHGRSGANVGIVQALEKKMDEGHMSYDELAGGLRSMSKWADTYARKKGAAPSATGGSNQQQPADLVFDPATGTFKKP